MKKLLAWLLAVSVLFALIPFACAEAPAQPAGPESGTLVKLKKAESALILYDTSIWLTPACEEAMCGIRRGTELSLLGYQCGCYYVRYGSICGFVEADALGLLPADIDIAALKLTDAGCGDMTDTEQAYLKAKHLLYTRCFDEAFEALREIKDYKDCGYLLEYAQSYRDNEQEYSRLLLDDKRLDHVYEHGKLYRMDGYGKGREADIYRGLIYIPDDINDDTAFVQYYSGGAGEDYLWYGGVYSYFNDYYPNSIIVFTNESGTTRIAQRNAWQWDILRQIAYECGTIVHDLSTLGSSHGAYTSMKLAYDYYANYGLRVKNVCTLDTGFFWEVWWLALSAEECRAVAEAGTAFWLFEEAVFKDDLQKDTVRNLLDNGVDCCAYICKNGSHSVISQNAYSFGVFSFCAGEEIYLPSYQYCRVNLSPGSYSLGELSWTERPETDTRKLY